MIMRFTTAAQLLTFFITTLVVVTTSSSVNPPNPARNNVPPQNWKPPQGCTKVGSDDGQKKLRRRLGEDSQSPGIDAAALELRNEGFYPCGHTISGHKSFSFMMFHPGPFRLAWAFAPGAVAFVGETVRLMRYNHWAVEDILVAEMPINQWQSAAISPVVGALYYVQLRGLPNTWINWWIDPAYASPCHASFSRIAN